MGKPKHIQKKDLVQAAKLQLLSLGQGSITLKSVAEAAGVTQGVIYYHFKTKQQLLLALLEQYEEDMKKQVQPNHSSVKGTITEEMYKAQTSSDDLRLLTELAAMSWHHKELKQKLGQVIRKRIQLYGEVMNGNTKNGRLLVALIDGFSVQAAMDPSFPEREMYQLALEILDGLKE